MRYLPVLCRLGLAMLAAVSAWPAVAEVYKWVDEQGGTHYSETAPIGRSARQIDIPSAPRTGTPSKSIEEQAREMRQQRLQREQAEDARRNHETGDPATRRERCLKAQRTAHILEMQRPIYSINEHGERVFMEDSDRPAAIEAARRDVQTYCTD